MIGPFIWNTRRTPGVSSRNFDRSFDDGLGPPNAALTFVRDDQSQGVVVKVQVKAVIQHTDDPNGPTYVYKLE